jgi:pimeloyl-ACP methyl ester carboxylesterase
MGQHHRLILLHGLEGSSQGFKATFLRQRFPHILTPDFRGPLEQRMEQLQPIIADTTDWVMIGSSLGGLMATLFAAKHPHQVYKLILLAPALVSRYFHGTLPDTVPVHTIIYHGTRDTVIPIKPVRTHAERIFAPLTFHTVDDDHMLHATFQAIEWETLVQEPSHSPHHNHTH